MWWIITLINWVYSVSWPLREPTILEFEVAKFEWIKTENKVKLFIKYQTIYNDDLRFSDPEDKDWNRITNHEEIIEINDNYDICYIEDTLDKKHNFREYERLWKILNITKL